MAFSKAFALLLSVIPLISASEHIHSTHLRHRRQTIPPTLPGDWTSEGCVSEGTTGRALTGPNYASGTEMTIENCINFCDTEGAIYAGVEYSVECFCGHSLSNGGGTPTTDCNMPCSGNSLQPCGGPGKLNLFWSGAAPPPAPSVIPEIGDHESLGCYTDNVNGQRTLPVGTGVTGPMTNAKCTDACFNAGYRLSGTEYAAECFCGHSLVNDVPAAAGDCNMVCAGDGGSFCGGPNRLNVYNYTGTDLPGGGGPPPGGPQPVEVGLPTTWTYGGCYTDNINGRVMGYVGGADPAQTVQTCIGICAAEDFTLAGIEFGAECFCGNSLINGPEKVGDGQCSMGCGGDNEQACGGPNLMSVYTSTGDVDVVPVPTTQIDNLPGNYKYEGCLVEAVGFRIIPNQILWERNNSAVACMEQCAKFGFPVSATEYGYECYCGDEKDITDNNGVFVADSECNMPCPGDPAHICGAGNRLTTYYWDGAMYNWKTPAVTGQYECFFLLELLYPAVADLYASSLVIPLITTVGINNKVTVLEKYGTGYPNTTGAYEIDISLAPSMSAWREMNVETDVFCAGSVILPDKAGRQLNVGGWSLDSTFGVRLFTPDGVEGTPSVNNWEEDFTTLALQRGRWYPTAAVLANGTVLVIGGETGSNGPPQPNLEIFPKPEGGDTVVELEWLARTDPYNLYPFVVVLPSQNVFVAYWNEARILDPVTFDTIRELPNMPGAVNDFLAGRTYPLEGAMVPIPQHFPFTDPLEVLMCGGSTIGAAYALDNCVRGAPEAETVTWTIERMPSRRVMPCMVSLPDGTVLIVNGAHHGVAGFGLGEDPNLTAVLYNPADPIHERMSILGSTDIARMYHSEATLLADGRVLISGSDPETDLPDGTPKYPQEFRLEVYVPPYLVGRTQPTFVLPNHDWAYGQPYTITNVNRFHNDGPVRVSLMAAASSTHGNTMGARTIFPSVTCVATTCTIIAPPNAGVSPPGWHMLFVLDGDTPSKAQWVRIGGDPAEIGNWPDLPGFTLPGI
ncbi:copper radical oxidase [Coprinopsis marcescibilis]|uniref:Copper radical oxidase n=1 Tax=Coprinopsis marcescibilis TaxID=230819 RepID=A0A5C3KQM1_COPMA|nr:copper radical oxidase [Coprinopsis marcescibilis]